MKPFHIPCTKQTPRRRHGQQAVALFIVLAFLVLISVLIAAFLSSVTTEVSSARSYASGATVKQLADSTTQLVVAQITDATKGQDPSSNPIAWASQPGMIRNYKTDGYPYKFYKLYSAGLPLALDMTGTTGTSFNPAVDNAPKDWNNPANPSVYSASQGVYTDLNSPVTHDGKTYFPIIDGNGIRAANLSGSNVYTYTPIIGGTTSDIEGFSIDKSQVNYDGNPAKLSGTNNPVPMPVRWLYMLQDGKIASPGSSNNGTVSFPTDPKPSSTNPVVGRIAFWTDDDTCKVNINTASEGTFWDRPWANTETEQHFATAIPALNEFQRFQGHPAKTCLSPILGSILPFPTTPAWIGDTATNQIQLDAYYSIVPRIVSGGSEGGIANEDNTDGTPNTSFKKITLDADRLYDSVDEFFYTPTLSGTLRQKNSEILPGSVALDNTFLGKARFFLTAHSRTPEINLFGKPRITLWPLQTSTANRNAKDRLIAFCSTIGGLPYYFQRYSTYATAGSIANASSQSATMDWQKLPRNADIYNYLDQLSAQGIPGFGGSFSAKYPNTRKQIITEMFDMIRSGVNSYNKNDANSNCNYVPTYLDPGEGQVIPIQPGNGTQGFGRTTTLVGAALVFYRANTANCTSTNGTLVTNPNMITPLNPSGVVITPAAQIGATLILNPYTPSPGLPPLNPNLQYVVSGLSGSNGFKINSAVGDVPLPFPSGSLVHTVTARSEFSGLGNCTPYFGVVSSFRYAGDNGQGVASIGDGTVKFGTGDPIGQYAFSTGLAGAAVGPNDTTFNFDGGTIKIEVYAGADVVRENVLQTINMTFPPVTGLLVPTLDPLVNGIASNSTTDYFGRIATTIGTATGKFRREGLVLSHPIPDQLNPSPLVPPNTYWWGKSKTPLGKDSTGNPVSYWVQDVVRGVEADPDGPAKGDLRIYAALPNVPASYFRPCKAPDGSAAYDFAVSGTQQYTNVQTLRDDGADANGAGGFGNDNTPYTYAPSYANLPVGPGVAYPHYPTFGGGSLNGIRRLLISTFATGVLVPKSSLALYGRSDNDASFLNAPEYRSSAHPAAANGLVAALTSGSLSGDWDNMTGLLEDGAFINKPDEGNGSTVSNTSGSTNIDVYYGTKDIGGGYFATSFSPTNGNYYSMDSGTSNTSTFSPNRQVSSAVMFGSLPTGIDPSATGTSQPWQTLLFCPNPAAIATASSGNFHPGFGTSAVGTGDSGPPYTAKGPPDHLLLDLFTMPIVEPYAISEPFSTAGKINMNYQILPFTYITRDTGVRAVLKSARVTAIPQSLSTITSTLGNSYKDGKHCKYELRYNINPDETVGTLAGFRARFLKGDIFRCPSEICSIFLVPQKIPTQLYPPNSGVPTSYDSTTMANWWSNFQLTGDNTREMPYGDIYPRLTTKSNTYTVHMRVQTLKKVPGSPTDKDKWIEGRDQVTGEYRGSQTIERYIDTNDATLPDFAAAGAPSAEGYYKIRIINSTTFTP